MSVTFSRVGADEAESYVNLSNVNAADLLRFLGLPYEPCGELPARELAALCGRAVMRIAGDHAPGDGGRMRTEERLPGRATVITCEREPGYLVRRSCELRALAIAAGDGVISWG